MPDLPIAASDRPLRPDQYVYVETHAWWLGTHGPHQHLAEHRLREWIPAQPDREWVLERQITGAQRWISGSAEEAIADGYDLRPAVPVGWFRARHGAFDALTEGDERSCRPPAPRRGSWQSPTREFFSRLPRDPEALVHRLREENTGSWFGPYLHLIVKVKTSGWNLSSMGPSFGP